MSLVEQSFVTRGVRFTRRGLLAVSVASLLVLGACSTPSPPANTPLPTPALKPTTPPSPAASPAASPSPSPATKPAASPSPSPAAGR